MKRPLIVIDAEKEKKTSYALNNGFTPLGIFLVVILLEGLGFAEIKLNDAAGAFVAM